MSEVIFEEREDLMEDLAEVEADEYWWTVQDADEEYVRSWEYEHVEFDNGDY
jgi:hypothetical protein